MRRLVVNNTHAVLMSPRGRSARGFSLVDVIVTMAVITLLISLLMPTLSTVRETAHQVVCRSNVRQMGIGLGMFAEDHKDLIPRTMNVSTGVSLPWETNTLRYGPDVGPPRANQWDGLGHLYRDDYLPAPKLFYCPSHQGANPYMSFEAAWGSDQGLILSNYQYRGLGPRAGGGFTNLLPMMLPTAALISDCLRTADDFNHEIGANLFRANMSVSWYSDRHGQIARLLPKPGETPQASTIMQAWSQLDEP